MDKMTIEIISNFSLAFNEFLPHSVLRSEYCDKGIGLMNFKKSEPFLVFKKFNPNRFEVLFTFCCTYFFDIYAQSNNHKLLKMN